MNTPFFVGIGAQRSGTSWISQYLTDHPEVGFSPVKELHYFDVLMRDGVGRHFNGRMVEELLKIATDLPAKPPTRQLERLGRRLTKMRCLAMRLEMMTDPRRYREYFELLAEDGHKVVGEITPAYATLDRAGFAAIRGYFDDAKFLFLLRDPVDRFLSQAKYTNRKTDVKDVVKRKNLLEFLEDERYVLRSNYKRTLIELGAVADRENICVAFFEHMMNPDTHRAELERITDFLGIECRESDIARKVNPGRDAEVDPQVDPKLAAVFAETYEYIEAEFGDRVPDRWRERMALV